MALSTLLKKLTNLGKKPAQNPVVTFEMESGATFRAELYPQMAPNTVANFVDLVQKGFYNGLVFHRVIKGFMIQGGDPDGTGLGGPGYHIRGEFAANGFRKNTLSHTRGVISMARSQLNDTAGSQFFVMHADSKRLDGQYAAFGRVIEGMDAVDAIAECETGAQDRPVAEQRMKTVTVETFGATYEVKKN